MYGGTKTEMERLLKDAEKISGMEFDISSFADVTEAIHIIQENMGIADATAEEAETTIEGSLNSMKAAWTNLVTGIANENANTEILLNEFLLSVQTFASNVIPIFATALSTILTMLVENGPAMLVQGVNNLNRFLAGLTTKMPEIIAFMGKMVIAMGKALIDMLPYIISVGLSFILNLANEMIKAATEMGRNIVSGVWNGIQAMAGWFRDSVMGFFSNIVNSVKSALGIHSPSRVFAEIGKNMALGLGGGWGDSINGIKSDIMSDMDFGTATIKANAEYGSNGIFGGTGGKTVSVVQNIYSQAQTAADLMEEAIYNQEKAVLLGV